MPTIAAFDPPANINDMSPLQRQAWHETLSSWFDENIAVIGGTSGANRSQFYNPCLESTDPPSIAETDGTITWQGFPKVLENQYGVGTQQAWQRAEELRNGPNGPFRPQDEYLEWRTERDAADQITRVTFTCEPPEYWEALAEGYPRGYGGPRSHAGAGDHAQGLRLLPPARWAAGAASGSFPRLRLRPTQPMEHQRRHRSLDPGSEYLGCRDQSCGPSDSVA